METSATHKYLRIAPRKVRLVAGLIKGKSVAEAQAILRYTVKGAVEPMEKVLHSAISSAKHNVQADENNLYIARVIVNEGPKLKRFRPRARGRAYPIQKKTSHITVTVQEITPRERVAQDTGKVRAVVSDKRQVSEKRSQRTKPAFRPAHEEARSGGTRKNAVQRIFRRKAV